MNRAPAMAAPGNLDGFWRPVQIRSQEVYLATRLATRIDSGGRQPELARIGSRNDRNLTVIKALQFNRD